MQNGANVLRRMIEIAGKLDFLVSDLRDLRDRALKVFLHEIAHGVELETHAVDMMRLGCPYGT